MPLLRPSTYLSAVIQRIQDVTTSSANGWTGHQAGLPPTDRWMSIFTVKLLIPAIILIIFKKYFLFSSSCTFGLEHSSERSTDWGKHLPSIYGLRGKLKVLFPVLQRSSVQSNLSRNGPSSRPSTTRCSSQKHRQSIIT